MQHIQVIQIGVGGVGQALIRQVLAGNDRWTTRYNLRFDYTALADSHSLLRGTPTLDPATITAALGRKTAGEPLTASSGAWLAALPASPTLVVDVSGSDATTPMLTKAVEQGHAVVLANKKPLAAAYNQFMALADRGRTRYEATVGAGLPVIATLQQLLDTGDEVREIAGCFSGTLGFVFSELEHGRPFSAAVLDAKARGWTEPDPRDDLGGMDVARKGLILARTCGQPLQLDDLAVEPLFTPEHATLAPAAFLAALPELDAPFAARMQAAQRRGNTLRYVASVNRTGATIGVREVPQASVLGSLQGPDNLVQFTTARYAKQPLVVRGPGAGTERTAAAVLGDMLVLAQQWR